MNVFDNPSILASAGAAGANFTSIPVALDGLREASIHVKFSSNTLNGTLAIQVSNDPTAFSAPSSADWIAMTDYNQVVASGVSHGWNIQDLNFKYMRFVWTYSSGTGTLTAWLDVKYYQG